MRRASGTVRELHVRRTGGCNASSTAPARSFSSETSTTPVSCSRRRFRWRGSARSAAATAPSRYATRLKRVVRHGWSSIGTTTPGGSRQQTGPTATSPTCTTGRRARLSELRTDSGATTRYEYDANGLLSTVTDPDGYTISVTRHEDGLPATVSDGVVEQTFDYDTRGRTIEQRTGDLVTTYSYDQLGRPLGERTGSQRRGFRYDSAGRLTSLVDNDLRQEYTYDEFGRLIESDSSTGDQLSVSWDWQPNGRRAA